MKISDEHKKILLSIARKTIQNSFEEVTMPKFEKDDELLNSKSGAFVTLTLFGELRGCIGFITSHEPLYETVSSAAYLAANEDPRFPPVTKKEFENVSIEISVLSEPFKLNSYEEITVGKHGLILKEGSKRGLLLPQVPIEHNLSKEEFLEALCNKAKLPKNLWEKKFLNLEAFTATVFSEEEFGE